MAEKKKRIEQPTLGRPPLTGEAMRRVLVTLDADTIKRAQKLGAGNLSAGLRKAVAQS